MILFVFIKMFIGYITPKNLLKTIPNTLQKPPKNTPKYPPNKIRCFLVFFCPEKVLPVKINKCTGTPRTCLESIALIS